MGKLKKFLIVIFLVFIGTNLSAQEVEIIEARPDSNMQFELDIDEKRFSRQNDNYFDQEGKGVIHVGLRKVSYDAMKNHFGKNNGGLIKIIEEKEIVLDGVSFLYAKQEQDRAGVLVEMISYVKKYEEDSILSIGAAYPKGENKKYKVIAEKAAITLKVVK